MKSRLLGAVCLFVCATNFCASAHAALVSAVLPTSRSAVVGTTVTAFATVINSGTELATDCSIAPGTPVAADFFYQTTDPATNALIGTADTPVDIPAGGVQTFVVGLTPTSPFSSTDVAFAFDCANTDPATTTVGLNTLLLSASGTPVPDIVALAATTSADGVVELARRSGAGAFAVATVNVGTAAQITAALDTGSADLPMTLLLCETNPSTGACISDLGTEVATLIGANATPTFAIFPTGTAPVDFDPANKRVFVRFRDDSGEVRGSTSVAVKTLKVDVQFAGGGGVMLPEGSMSNGAAITATSVAAPGLPDDLEPLAGAINVEATEQPSRPIEIRLPLPAGEDPDDLTIYRYEDDGTLTLLGTSLDGTELVAGAPGFSRFGIARSFGIRTGIAGPRFLDLGAEAFYKLLAGSPGFEVWTYSTENYAVYGPLTIGKIAVYSDGDVVSITAGESEGLGTIANEFNYYVTQKGATNPETPVIYRGFASVNVSVQDFAGPPGPLAVHIIAADTTLYLGQAQEPRDIYATVENLPHFTDYRFRWRWDYGDSVTGSEVSDRSIDIPGHRYPATGVYTVTVSATALDPTGAETGARLEAQFLVEVRDADDFFAWIDGPVSIDNPGDSGQYTARTLGGTPEFDFRWQVLPGGQIVTGTSSTQTLTFPRAGGALVHLTVTDTELRETEVSLPVTVGGAEPLLASLAAPGEAEVGESVTATVTISGGVVIANGQEGKYQVTVDWGDGERSNTDVDPFGLPGLPGAPDTTVDLSHAYSSEGTYYPVAYVTDVTGNVAESDPVTVVVGSANQDPVAVDDAWSVWVEEAVRLPVLDNDLDPDGDPRFTLTVSAVGPTSNGGSAAADGRFVSYRPADNFVGIETFTYTVVDDKGGSASAQVTLDVWPRTCDENLDPVTVIYWLVSPPPYSGYVTVCEDDASRRWIQAGLMREVISIVEGGELRDVGQPVECWTEGEVVARIDANTTWTYTGYLCPAE